MRSNSWLLILISAFLAANAFAHGPAWWFERGEVNANLQPNDYASITCGQLKWGLGLSEDVWNANAVEDWTAWSFGSPVVIEDYWTSDLEEPPDITSGPAEANTTICSGFQIIEWKGLIDWNFQYCPDE